MASEAQPVTVTEKGTADLEDCRTTAVEAKEPVQGENGTEALIHLTVILSAPEAKKLQIMVSPEEQVHEVRQSIIDLPAAFQYTCFHLQHQKAKLNDFTSIGQIPNLGSDPEVQLVEDPYTEKEARIHFVRIREMIGAAGNRVEVSQGVLAGLTLFERVARQSHWSRDASIHSSPLDGYDFRAEPSLQYLVPDAAPLAPKTVKSLALSSWNPPPCHLKQRGHLLYIVITTNEGEQFQVTSHVSGFYVNKSSNTKFDPFPRLAAKSHAAHSLLELISQISPSFDEAFRKLQEHNGSREPLSTFQITNAIPSTPWIVPSPTSVLVSHISDPARPQESLLLAGVENTDTLRDWNEEFQSAKELPKESLQDRAFRERLLSKLFADYNDAATKGAVMVARGEIAPLNPTEAKDAQIFVYNNIFFSFGADGVGTFTSEGGDEAARVATGKDVAGVRLVNQLDIDDLFAPATVVVDYLGKRVVGQSIVPGIFKQREPGENQIDYGAVDGKDVVSADDRFASSFSLLSKALKVKSHPVWDKSGKRFDLEASVETKGLMGTDGRKYVLDLYRITPCDINWLEETRAESENQDPIKCYPHRMALLRPELIDSYARLKMKQWVDDQLAQHNEANLQKTSKDNGEENSETTDPEQNSKPQLDLSRFKLGLNPDAFSGQTPSTDEEKQELQRDEQDVREAGDYLREQVIPNLLRELSNSDISFPMDGRSLSRLLHKRGINVRYLGLIASRATDERLRCLQIICIQDMVARAFKHVAAVYLRALPVPFTAACMAHLLNCLLGCEVNPTPKPEVDASLRPLYSDADFSFETVTPELLRKQIEGQVYQRFRYDLGRDWSSGIRNLQLLRECSLKLGLQIQAKDYVFSHKSKVTNEAFDDSLTNDVQDQMNGDSKEKKKRRKKPITEGSPGAAAQVTSNLTFLADDIVDVVPLVKHSAPRSALAEEAFETGRLSIMQNDKKLGQELLLESLSLHEQIYGMLHPEVAKVYNSLSMLYYQLDDKEVAVELAKKAVIVGERTVGADSAETLLNYLNLSLFMHQTGDSRSALMYSVHALMLEKIIYGPGHPDSITTMNNVAVMLQHLKNYHESRIWFEESLHVCESIFGKQSINSATLLFQLAQALALDHDSKGAVKRMRESYNIFHHELGPEDKNTKEAEGWLEQLTQNAVSIAKHAKTSQARRVQSDIRFQATVPPEQQSTPDSRRNQALTQVDPRSIDELIRFIDGVEQKTPITRKRPGRGNPRRKGQPAAA